MKIGYVRCSTSEQNTERQEVLMERLGVEKIYIDRCSGKDMHRPKLKEMMDFMREGDTVIVESWSRLARSTRDLLQIADTMTQKGVEFISQKEQIDTSTPAGRLMLTVFAAISEFERECILQRQAEGIALKKARGEYKGRVPISIDNKAFEAQYKEWKSGKITARAAMANLGLKANTFYRRVNAWEEEHGHYDVELDRYTKNEQLASE